MGALALSRESPIPNTLCAFLVVVVLMQVGGWIKFVWLAFPGSCPLCTHFSFSNPKTSHLLCRSTSGDEEMFKKAWVLEIHLRR